MDVVEEAIPGSELTVERVRTEVRALTERIAAKQWEVQLMVGSRYHELIDSADSVVSMYRSCKRLQLSLGDLKENLHSLGQMKPAAQLAPPDDRKFVDARSRPDTLMQSDVVFMLHAPTEIWSSIDRRELLPATRAYLKAKRIAAAATAMQSSDDEVVKRMQSVVLRQWACVSDLSKAIKDGVHELLGNQDVVGTEAHAAGVGALCLVEGLSVQQALAVYLEARSLWLRDDFSSSLESLDGDVETVQLKLTRSVQALSRTLVDTYRIFAHPHLSSHLKLDDVALPSVGRAAVAEALTQWLSRHIEETYRRSQSMLKLVRTSNELAKVRQALWAEARAAAEHDSSLWKDACSSLILMDRLRASLSRGLSMSLPFSNTSAALDLWTVLFSRSFAVLAEDLLSEALAKVKTSLVQQLESVLVTIRGEQRGRLTAVEMAWAADHMGRNLTAQVESIGRQADSLVQEGDSHASGALAVSLRTQTLRLLAHVVAYVRVLATSLAEDDQVDGLLIEVRLAWYLSRHLGTSLLDEAPPAGLESAAGGQPSLRSSSARGEATIDFVQLESAFTIADMRGTGVLSQEELKDALDTIGLGGSDGGMPSCTLPEFALLCSPVLEERCPSRFLREALEAVFRQGLAAWAAVAVRQLATPLRSAVGSMAGKAGVTDALWRGRHPGWEEKLLLQEDEAGGTLEDRVWLPTHVSPWLSVYLFSLSAELSRVTQSRDCLEPGLGGDACLMEAFRHSLVRRARAELETCLTSIKPAALCEAAVLQCALDHLFLHHWLQQEGEEEGGAGEAMLPGWSAVQQQLDPINYQMYEPTLLEAVRAQSAASALILTFLLQRTAPPGKAGLPAASHARALSSTGRRAKSMSEDLSHSLAGHNGGGSSSNTIPLVAAVPRFTLLPVVVEASTAASTRLSSPPRDAHHRKPSGGSAFGFNFSPDGATGPGGMGGKGGAAGGVGHAATVLSSFSSLSALGNQAASTATSFLSRATSSKRS